MLSLLCGLAFGAPDESLLSSLAAVEARTMLPIIVGVHDERLANDINRADVRRDDLHLVVVLLHDDRPGIELQKVMKTRSMRCGVEILPDASGQLVLTEYGRCDARKRKAADPATAAPSVAPTEDPDATM